MFLERAEDRAKQRRRRREGARIGVDAIEVQGDFAEAASVLYTPEELEEMARRRGVASSAVLHWLETDPYSFAELALEGVTPPGRNSDLSPVTHYLLCAVDRMEDEDPAFVLGLAVEADLRLH